MIRRLGHNERYQLARCMLDQYRGTSVLCRYKIPTPLANPNARKDLVDTLNIAIVRVLQQAPTLQVGISGTETLKPFWIQLGSIDLRNHVQWLSPQEFADSGGSLQDILATQLDQRFPNLDVLPGWNLLLINQDATFLDILFVWNHIHTGGTGGKIFHQLLLEALKNPRADVLIPSPIIQFPDSAKEFPPPIEQVAGLPLTPGFVLKEVWNEYKPLSIFPRAIQADWAPIRSQPYKTRFLETSIPHEVWSRVVGTCRSRGTTITGVLNGLVLMSLARRISVREASAFASGTAIDQRRFVPLRPEGFPWLEPERAVTNYVSVMTHEYNDVLVGRIRSMSKESTIDSVLSEDLLGILWSTAIRVRGEVSQKLAKGLRNDIPGMSLFVPDFKKQFLRDAKRPRKLSWFLTNIGVLDGEPGKVAGKAEGALEWCIDRAQFTLSTEIPVAALLIGVSSVKGKDLVITCTWQDTVVEEALVSGLMKDLKTWLGQMGA